MIPKDIQFGLLAFKVGKTVAKNFRTQLERRLDPRCSFVPDAVRKEENEIIALNWSYDGKRHTVYHGDINTGELTLEHEFSFSTKRAFFSNRINEWHKFRERINMYNMRDLEEIIQPIKLYLESAIELSNELGIKIQRVDTEREKAYLEASSNEVDGEGDALFWIRARAVLLGADALVKCQNSKSSYSYEVPSTTHVCATDTCISNVNYISGTPVKFIEGSNKYPN